jgi:hypothetical protein
MYVQLRLHAYISLRATCTPALSIVTSVSVATVTDVMDLATTASTSVPAILLDQLRFAEDQTPTQLCTLAYVSKALYFHCGAFSMRKPSQ